MPTQKKRKKSQSRVRGTKREARAVPVAISGDVAFAVPVPEPTTDVVTKKTYVTPQHVVTEKTYVTTEPEVEIRKSATLAQALTEPGVVVVKPKTKVRKQVVARTRRSA